MSQKIKSILMVVLMAILTLLLIYGQQYWQLDLVDLNLTTKVTTEYNKLVFYKGITFLGKTLYLVVLGFLLASETKLRYLRVAKLWLITVVTSITLQVVVLYLNDSFSGSDLYNSLLPLLRNTYPLASGVMLGLCLLKKAQEYFLKLSWRQILVVTIILTGSPTIFGQDPLAMWSGTGLTFGLVMFLVGALIAKKQVDIQPWLALALGLISGGVYLLLNYWMPYISRDIHGDYSTAGRFLNNGALPAVLFAFFVGLALLPYFRGIRRRWRLTFANFAYLGLLLATNNVVLPIVKNYFDKKYPNTDVLIKAKAVFTQCLGQMGWLILGTIILALLAYLPLNTYLIRKSYGYDLVDVLRSTRSWCQSNKRYLYGLIGAIILAYSSFIFVSPNFKITLNMGPTYSAWQYVFLARPMMIWLNALIIIALWCLLFGITNRYWVSTLGVAISMLVLFVTENIKVGIRNEPILPSEIVMLKAIGELLHMADTILLVGGALGLSLGIGLIVYLEKKYPQSKLKWYSRLVLIAVACLFFSPSFFLNHNKGKMHIVSTSLGNDPTFYNQLLVAQQNGPLLQFLNNVDTQVMVKPAGYSKAKMAAIAKKYNLKADLINQTRKNDWHNQSVIFSLSESFANPNRVPGVELANNPIKRIDNLMAKNTSGLMLSSGYGGGTANIEYMTLTGLTVANFSATLPTPYTQLVPFQKQAWSFNQLFAKSTAIHPYQGVFYSRPTTYKKFGFERFYHLGSKYKITVKEKIDRSPYLDDNTAFANTLKVLKERGNGQFINLVSMQNHFPYDKDFYDGTEKYTANGSAIVDENTANMVSDFATGLSYTDKAVANFIKEIDKIQRPVTIVFYGDHLPGIYNGNDMKKDGVVLHETDYFIYSNKYARKHGAKTKMVKATGLVAPNDFPAMVAEQTNSKVNGYLALLTEVKADLPAMSTDPKMNATNNYNTMVSFVTKKGKILKLEQLTPKQQKLYHDYQLVQYDMTAGKQYLLKNHDFSK
ncbi:sulfatase-like hydrolase/transferase [Ligilactobacillus agilis]|uniref:sulfatase-like hydrolase/transferase n=2 Tax=Ligilactobacillus agilis TaxID=1601 RepID=UPI0022E2157D|nr:sulfatase-like hydrolase/transferase [Ligilactobacillus agilis]